MKERPELINPPTFSCGTGGVWERMADEQLLDELLYGRTGYLHSLLWGTRRVGWAR